MRNSEQYLPLRWVSEKLKHVIEPRGEKVSPADYPGYKFIGMDHVEAHTTRIIGSISASQMKSNAALFYAGDVLYGRLRPYLNKVAKPAFNGLASAEFIVFPDTDLIVSEFLKYRLNAADFVSFASHLNEGDRPRVSFDQIGEFRILVPPPAEQRRIVAKIEALFSELDKGVESLKTAREQLKIYRQAVLKHAFEGKLTAQWREENKDKLRLPESISGNNRQGEKQLIESVDIPEVWGWSIVRDILLEGPSNGRSVKDRADGFPVLRLTALKKGRIDLAERKYGDWNRETALPFIVKPGDFLLSRGNGSKHLVGRGGVVPEHKGDVAFPDTMVRLRVDPSVMHIDFFRLLWESRVVRNQIELAARTTAGIYKINQNHIQSFWIPIPSIDEQRTIIALLEEKLSVVEELERDLEIRLAASEALRQSILKKAFSGQLVPQDPNDEPASVLLERIKAEKARRVGSKSARNSTRKTRAVHKEVN